MSEHEQVSPPTVHAALWARYVEGFFEGVESAMAQVTRLKPCPACGGPAKLHKRRKKYWYECDGDCWTQTSKYLSPELAALEWNTLEKKEETNDAT